MSLLLDAKPYSACKDELIRDVSRLCIPRVENTISKEFIYKKIQNAQFGRIIKIIEIPSKKEANYKRIIIKLKWNETNNQTQTIKEKLQNGEQIKLVYSMPWFWKIVISDPGFYHTR